MAPKFFHCLLLVMVTIPLFSQDRIGINTTAPQRMLHVSGSFDQFLRIHSTPQFGSEAGLELLRGASNVASNDWRIVNTGGVLRYLHSTDNFTTAGEEFMKTYTTNLTGVGTSSPYSKLHIDGGTQFTFGGYGFMKVGPHGSTNLAFDNRTILALDNGQPAGLFIQDAGGDTYINSSGGNTYLATEGGKMGIGVSVFDGLVNVESNSWQMTFHNDTDGDANDWYIGASNDNWAAGDDQLVFSPTSSSADAVFRLMDVSENDGTNAPVMIQQTQDYTILMDGNEIDTRGTPLYINHNSNENTLLNTSAGRVGINTTSPDAIVDVVTTGSTYALSLQRGSITRDISPSNSTGGPLNFYAEGNDLYAVVSGWNGAWTGLSDKNRKENILPVSPVLDRVNQLKLYSYSFKSDTEHRKQLGLIAQEVEPVFPEMIKVRNDQYGMAYDQLAAVGIKAIQEQQVVIDALREKINLIRKQMADATNPADTTIKTSSTN